MGDGYGARMIREDYIMRIIRQLAVALARIAGFRHAGKHEEALDEAGKLYDELGVPREVCDVVDTPTLAALLVHPDKIRALAQVCWEEGRIYQAKGRPAHNPLIVHVLDTGAAEALCSSWPEAASLSWAAFCCDTPALPLEPVDS